MNYILTQEELDKLAGSREQIRAEFQMRMDAKLMEFRSAMTRLVNENSPRNNPNLPTFYAGRIDGETLMTCIIQALNECKLTAG